MDGSCTRYLCLIGDAPRSTWPFPVVGAHMQLLSDSWSLCLKCKITFINSYAWVENLNGSERGIDTVHAVKTQPGLQLVCKTRFMRLPPQRFLHCVQILVEIDTDKCFQREAARLEKYVHTFLPLVGTALLEVRTCFCAATAISWPRLVCLVSQLAQFATLVDLCNLLPPGNTKPDHLKKMVHTGLCPTVVSLFLPGVQPCYCSCVLALPFRGITRHVFPLHHVLLPHK
jgi:hypothetical protein